MILLICIGIAGTFWVMSVLSKSHTSTLQVKTTYSNLPEAMVFLATPASSINVRVNAKGWDLMAHYLEMRTTHLKIDISSLDDIENIPGTDLAEMIQKVLPADSRIIALEPDRLVFSYEKRALKTVIIKPQIKIDFEKQYYLNAAVQVEPDSIKLIGANSILDKIQFWETETLKLEGVRESFEMKLNLAKPGNIPLDLSQDQVLVKLSVEEFTEASLEVTIHELGVPDGLELVLIPGKATLTFHVPLSDYEKISQNLFQLNADFKEIDVFQNNTIQLRLDAAPGFVQNLHIKPEIVEYIIHK